MPAWTPETRAIAVKIVVASAARVDLVKGVLLLV
jgi:hypothetical protein